MAGNVMFGRSMQPGTQPATAPAPAAQRETEATMVHPPVKRSRSWWRVEWLWALVTVAGVALRVVSAAQPLNQPSWREGDFVAMARSFARETLNPFSPRVAWRGTSTGEAESEFPLISWLTGQLWRAVGERDLAIRMLPLLFGLVTIVVFGRFAHRLLGSRSGWCATAILAVNPLAIYTSSRAQSDSLMLLGVVLAVASASRWMNPIHRTGEEKPGRKGAAVVAPLLMVLGLVIAGLSKLPALHVGIVIVWLVVTRRGWRGLFAPSVMSAGLLGFGLPVVWAAYARGVYSRTGLSLGVSNERHWAGAELFTDRSLLIGIARHEGKYVWLLLGIPLALVAVIRGRRLHHVQLAMVWFGAVVLMLLVAGRTTGDAWAFYYHLAAAPPAALLIGFGAHSTGQSVLNHARHLRQERTRAGAFGAAIALLLAFGTVALAGRTAWRLAGPQPAHELFVCAQKIDPLIGSIDLVLTSGGTRLDSGGHAVAYDASYMFQWTDTFGWTLPLEDQSIAEVDRFKAKGARWLIAERDALQQASAEFQRDLPVRYRRVVTCDAASLYELR